MAGFNGQGALTYGATGAAVGTAIAPGVGTAIGGGVGLLAGGLMGGENKPWYDEDWFTNRNNDITTFENQLAGARASYLTSLGNMYNQAYSRFSATIEPGFANRGLAVNGGAFASVLANKTADYQAEGDVKAADMARQDLNSVQGYRAQLFGQKLGAKTGSANMGYQAGVENDRALGGFAMNVGMDYLHNRRAGFNPNSAENSYSGGIENPGLFPRNTRRTNLGLVGAGD